jgi:Brp/Blh family beta-carotene 15,15'-monooxygenase
VTAVAATRRLFVVAAAATLAVVALATPSAAVQLALLVPLVAVLGVPHGALDIDMARALWPLERPAARLAFGLGYLAVAALVLGLWLIAPAAALVAFLLYSAAHFADDWRAELPRPARLAAGAAAVALPAAAHEAEVARLFAALAPERAAAGAAAGLHFAAPLLALTAVASAALFARRGAMVELVTLGVLGLAAPPLVYFAVYFCALHSPRHFVETLARLRLDWRRGVRAASPLTAATLAMATVAAVWLVHRDVALDAAALEIVFIGLAALAVPHMVLVERFWTRS